MPHYHAVFLHGDRVRIGPRHVLESLLASYRALNGRPPPDRLNYVGAEGNVDDTHYDHGGHVLYSIKGVPGVWPELALEDTMLNDPKWTGYPDVETFYSIEARKIGELQYVVLVDKWGNECLRRYSGLAPELADIMKYVAKRRHFVGFHRRYELDWVRLK